MDQLEEFKKSREAIINSERKKKPEEEEQAPTKSSNATENETSTPASVVQPSEIEPDSQTALGLEEPPALSAVAEPSNNWADLPTETQLKQWWEEFLVTQPVRISSLLRTVTPHMDKNEVVITVSPSKIEPLEPVKFPFNRFIRDISNDRLTKLRVEKGEVEQMERKPYTDKEKLEYMEKMNPLLKSVIEKLDLKLP